MGDETRNGWQNGWPHMVDPMLEAPIGRAAGRDIAPCNRGRIGMGDRVRGMCSIIGALGSEKWVTKREMGGETRPVPVPDGKTIQPSSEN